MHNENQECRGARDVTWYSVIYVSLLLLLLVPFGTWFAYRFWHKVSALSKKNSALNRETHVAVKAYIAFSTVQLWLGAYVAIGLPLLRLVWAPNLTHCAAVTFVVTTDYGCAYIAFQRILLSRLKVAFANSTHPVTQWVSNCFDAILWTAPLFAAAWAYMWTNACFTHTNFYELPPKKWTHIFCSTQVPIVFAIFRVGYVALLLCSNVSLIYMYVSRLKAVFIDANCRRFKDADSKSIKSNFSHLSKSKSWSNGSSERRAHATASGSALSKQASTHVVLALDLVRKSTVVTIWSVSSTVFVMLVYMIPFQTLAPLIDVIVNQVLIFCLFPFGDELYDHIFGCCHFTTDFCLPQHALEVESAFAQQMMREKASRQRQILAKARRPQPRLGLKPKGSNCEMAEGKRKSDTITLFELSEELTLANSAMASTKKKDVL